MQKGDQVKDISIETLSYGGEGISKQEGRAHIFVPFSAPGDKLNVIIDDVQKNHVHAIIDNIHTPSKLRKNPNCTYFSQCGGCHYQHLDKHLQDETKEKQVKESLEKISNLNDINITPITTDKPFHYRNKVTLHVHQGQELGYMDINNNFLAIDQCPIASHNINQLITPLKLALANNACPELLYITLRSSNRGEAIIFSFSDTYTVEQAAQWVQTKCKVNPKTSLYLCLINKEKHFSPFSNDMIHLDGPEKINESILNKSINIWPFIFWQNNPDIAQSMANKIVSWAKNNKIKKNLDLYCGAGLFSFALAQNKIYSLGVEVNEDAVDCAKEHALNTGLSKYSFFVANKVNKALETILENDECFDAITLDPPRKGLDKDIFKQIEQLNTQHIAYISCNPTTFARDAKHLTDMGYQLKQVDPLDMFPQTYHIELIAYFEKSPSQ
ncbi:MAG TPA: 23S rRNA (uracil(1939)-C(5))-methyltransferase RlmD [Oligoflexia bacterium]|mgnify:CR=1 FL=1|nr:23S rRNA (uracil(1939)-C(5))-methyltransferase RlmD [Oligoflexia bacterium]HMR23864.1 23S rRNA (uracil(1939)-C(5))-methyltransferase RlmD [Oligoflexia bacterium]